MIVEQSATEFARELNERLSGGNGDKRLMIGVVGYPGAGKSTFSQAIVEEFNRQTNSEMARVVPMDGYHYSNEKLEAMDLLPLKGIPESFDATAFVSLLERLRRNDGTVRAPLFDRSIEASIEDAIEIRKDHRLLVVEGNYLLLKDPPWHKCREFLDEVWFIDSTFETILPRLLERHKQGGKDEAAARDKVESTDLRNAYLIDATKIFADRLVSVRL